MRSLPLFCLATASLYALAAMTLGIYMAASHNHELASAHAHLNLVGWVTVALYGLFYHVVPAAGESRLAKVQVACVTIGVLLLAPGIALAVLGVTEGPAILGSFVVMLSMLLFAAVIVRSRAT